MYSIGSMIVILLYIVAKGRIDCFSYRREILAIAIIAVVSALVNFYWSGLLEIATKWLYLGLMIALVQYCFRVNSQRKVLLGLWICLLYPVSNQLFFFLSGRSFISGGVISYYGSFGHESDLGFLLLAFLATSFCLLFCSRGSLQRYIFGASVFYAHIAIYMNNYRTVTAALGIFWASIIFFSYRKISIQKRLALSVLVIVVPLGIIFFVGENLSLLFSDVFVFLSDPGRYLDFSGNAQPNILLSGRIDIFNKVMAAYTNAPFQSLLIGLGPGSAELYAGVYTHDEYLSALVETGIIGIVALIAIVFIFAKRCYRIAVKEGGVATVYASITYAILFTGVATMPFRDMRAMLTLSICLGGLELIKVSRRRQMLRASK